MVDGGIGCGERRAETLEGRERGDETGRVPRERHGRLIEQEVAVGIGDELGSGGDESGADTAIEARASSEKARIVEPPRPISAPQSVAGTSRRSCSGCRRWWWW